MSEHREFTDIRSGAGADAAPGLPVDEFMEKLETTQREIATAKNLVWERVADGTLSIELLKRFAKEYYFLGKWFTSEFGSIVSNAVDIDALDLGSSQHFLHWLQNLADETGYTGDHNHVDMKVEWARQLGVTDDELLNYRPMPESVGAVFTTLYYMRRPLGMPRVIPPDRLIALLDVAPAYGGFRSKQRARGLRLEATDVDWSFGSGPEVHGPAEALLMALSGRPVALAELAGDGVPTLTARVNP